MKRIPRRDLPKNDQFGVKAKLSEYANSVYQQSWVEAGCPEKITIGDHVFGCDPRNWETVYGKRTSPSYDGIHMRTETGKLTYTSSVIKAFKLAFPNIVKQSYQKNTGGYSPTNYYSQNTRGYSSTNYYRQNKNINFNNARRNNSIPVWENTPPESGVPINRTWSEVVKNVKKGYINPWQNNPFTLPLYNRWSTLDSSEN